MKYIPNYTVSKWRFYHWNVSHSRRPLSHDDSFQPLFVTAWFYGPIENVCPPVLRGHLTLCCDHWYTVKIIFNGLCHPNPTPVVLYSRQSSGGAHSHTLRNVYPLKLKRKKRLKRRHCCDWTGSLILWYVTWSYVELNIDDRMYWCVNGLIKNLAIMKFIQHQLWNI